MIEEPYEHDPWPPRTECPGEPCPECHVCPLCSIDGHVEGCTREGEEYTCIPLRQVETLAVSDVLL